MLEWGRRLAEPFIWVAAVGAALLLLLPRGFPNYDTIYYLLWGRELAQGMSPDYGAPLAPTPHPLYDLLGAVLSPLGDGAITVAMVLAYVSLGLVAWLVYRLGSEWLSRPVGAAAALVVLTSAPFLSNGLRAYIDIPYIALCLGALLIETRRPRAGLPVLALLALAGLLRPEAWLFAVVYVLYLAADEIGGLFGAGRRAFERPGRERDYEDRGEGEGRGRTATADDAGGFLDTGRSPLQLLREGVVRVARGLLARTGAVALAAAGPAIWIAFDWATTGDPLYSLTGTRETVESLERQTGPVDVVLYGPRRLGEVLQWPGMIGALLGVLLCLGALRSRVRLGVAGAVLALAAFALMGAAGLAVIPRYTMLAAAILAVFVGAALFGWRLLPSGDDRGGRLRTGSDRGRQLRRLRRPWQAAAVLVAALYVIWLPNQLDLLGNVDRDLSNQGLVERDLEQLVESGAFAPLGDGDGENDDQTGAEGDRLTAAEAEGCLPISAPNHRAVPRLAFWLDIRPSDVVSEDVRPGGTGGDIRSNGESGTAVRQRDSSAEDVRSGRDGADGDGARTDTGEERPGWYLAPARGFTIRNFILDPDDPVRETRRPPPSYDLVAENRSWRLYRDCR